MLHNRNRNSIIASLTTVRSKTWYRLLLWPYIFQRASSLNVWGMAAFHTRIKRHRWGSHFWRSLSDSYSAPHLASAAVWARVQKKPKKCSKVFAVDSSSSQQASCSPAARHMDRVSRRSSPTSVRLSREASTEATDGASLRLRTTGGHSGVFSVRQAFTVKRNCVLCIHAESFHC